MSTVSIFSFNGLNIQRDYAFNYDIADGFAGMTHARSEVRKNGITRGFYSYTRPDGVLVSVRYTTHTFYLALIVVFTNSLFVMLNSYTADESGFHPIITEEAAPSMVSNRAIQSMFSSDHPEEIKVTLTQEDVDLARRKLDEARMRSKQQLKHSMELLSPAASESQSVLLTAFPDAFTRSIETVSYSPTSTGETMARTAKLIQNDSSIVRKRVFTNSH